MSIEKELDKATEKLEKVGDKINEKAEGLIAKAKMDPKKAAMIVAAVVVVLAVLGYAFG